MRNTPILLSLLALVVIAAGCDTDSGTVGPSSGSFFGGTSALKMSFVENAPPDQILDGGAEEFETLVTIENIGESEIREGKLILKLVGIFPTEFGTTKDDLTYTYGDLDTENGLTQVRKDPDGNRIDGEFAQITFPTSGKMKFGKSLVGNQEEFVLRVDACYEYLTVALSQMCILEDFIKRTSSSVCDPSTSQPVANSAAPIHVTSVTQSVSGADTIILRFDVKAVGAGQIFLSDITSDPACSSDYNVRNRVKISVITGDDTDLSDPLHAGLECVGLIDLNTNRRQGTLILTNGEGSFSCIQKLTEDTQVDALKDITVKINYQIQDSISRPLIVKRQFI